MAARERIDPIFLARRSRTVAGFRLLRRRFRVDAEHPSSYEVAFLVQVEGWRQICSPGHGAVIGVRRETANPAFPMAPTSASIFSQKKLSKKPGLIPRSRP